MGFSEKAKQYFKKELGMTNRDISVKMDNYSEVLVSRYMNSDDISPTFLKKIQKYFPEADINWLISDDDVMKVEEGKELYTVEKVKKLDEAIELLLEFRKNLTHI